MSRIWTEVGLLNKFNRIRESHLVTLFPKYDALLKWRSNESVLDIGCGSGDLCKKFIYPLLPNDYKQLVCVDKSTEMLQSARKLFEGNPRVSFEEMDITADLAAEKKNKFNHIFSIWCLMWVANQTKAFQNIYELLAPGGGTFHIFVQNHIFIETIYQLVERPKWRKFIPKPKEVYAYPYRSDPDPVTTITKMLKDIGYVNVEVNLETNNFAFESENELLGFFQAIPNPLALMKEEEKEEYLKEAIETAYANKVIQPSGEFKNAGKILIVYGEK